jgi:hypothetical protein
MSLIKEDPMTATLMGLSRLCTAAALAALLVAVVLTGGRTAAAAVASDCDDSCTTGKTTDKNPCVTSAGGACTVSKTAPKGTDCDGCNPQPQKDGTGKIIGCQVSCSAITP